MKKTIRFAIVIMMVQTFARDGQISWDQYSKIDR